MDSVCCFLLFQLFINNSYSFLLLLIYYLIITYIYITASLDAMSAVCLLERYLEDCGDGAIPAVPCTYPPTDEFAWLDYEMVRSHIREAYYSKPLSQAQTRELMIKNIKVLPIFLYFST